MTDTTMIDRLKQFVEAKCALAPWILEALHHSTFIGCGEE